MYNRLNFYNRLGAEIHPIKPVRVQFLPPLWLFKDDDEVRAEIRPIKPAWVQLLQPKTKGR